MLKQFFLIFFILVATGCKQDPSVFVIKNLNENQIGVLGHGGMGLGYRYPMNSKESLLTCLSFGAAGTEMDVCVTKDSVVVLCHSQTLSDNTTCNGLIKEMNWEEIKNCNYKRPLLSEKAVIIDAATFFDAVENRSDLVFAFDCKIENEDKLEYLYLFAGALIKHIEKYNLVSNSFIESFNTSFLEILASKNKDLHLFLNTQNIEVGLKISKTIRLCGLTLDTKNISKHEIEVAHENNLRVALFNTQSEYANKEAVLKNPDFIQTDRVDFLVNVLK